MAAPTETYVDPAVAGGNDFGGTAFTDGSFANATNTIYINVFSCKLYDPYTVAEFTKAFFKGDQCTMNILLRK